jgi:uncharacterized protein YhfF
LVNRSRSEWNAFRFLEMRMTGGAVLRTRDVCVGALSSVDDVFAWDEGEADRTRISWLAEHDEFFRRYLPTIGVEFDPAMATVFERFTVVYAE